MDKGQLTCEINGVKYLRFYCELSLKKESDYKKFLDNIAHHDGIVNGYEAKRTGGFLFATTTALFSFLIPEKRVIEFCQSDAYSG